MEFVYFVGCNVHEGCKSENGWYKIGYTTGSPYERIKELQTGNPCLLGLIGFFECPSGEARALERALHDRYRLYRIIYAECSTEWFCFEQLQVNEITGAPDFIWARGSIRAHLAKLSHLNEPLPERELVRLHLRGNLICDEKGTFWARDEQARLSKWHDHHGTFGSMHFAVLMEDTNIAAALATAESERVRQTIIANARTAAKRKMSLGALVNAHLEELRAAAKPSAAIESKQRRCALDRDECDTGAKYRGATNEKASESESAVNLAVTTKPVHRAINTLPDEELPLAFMFDVLTGAVQLPGDEYQGQTVHNIFLTELMPIFTTWCANNNTSGYRITQKDFKLALRRLIQPIKLMRGNQKKQGISFTHDSLLDAFTELCGDDFTLDHYVSPAESE